MSPSMSRFPNLTLDNGIYTPGGWVSCCGDSKESQRVGRWKIEFQGWLVSYAFWWARTYSTLGIKYSIGTKLQKHVHIFFIFKNSFELANIFVLGFLMEFDLRQHLHKKLYTFCLALGFSNNFLWTIFKANFFLSPIRSASKHSANPPTCESRYLCQGDSALNIPGIWWSHRSFWSSNARSSVLNLLLLEHQALFITYINIVSIDSDIIIFPPDFH